MLRLKSVLLLLACLCMLQGCSYKGREAILKTQYDSDTVKTVFTINHNIDLKEYYNVIRPEDELSIRNLQNPSLIVGSRLDDLAQPQTNTLYKVDGDGTISLPILGKVLVAGLNRVQAASKIETAYQAQELKDPIIDVQIVNMYVTVIGEVNKQGKFLISREDLQLIDLLGEVGGFTADANKKSVKIIRGDRSNPEIILVNLNNYDFIKDKNLRLRSGDIVYVEPRRGLNFHNLKGYAGFVQLGILAINCLLIIYNR